MARHTVLIVSLVLALAITSPATSQEVAEIPFLNVPTGTAALGGGIRLGQSPYFANNNEDLRELDLRGVIDEIGSRIP